MGDWVTTPPSVDILKQNNMPTEILTSHNIKEAFLAVQEEFISKITTGKHAPDPLNIRVGSDLAPPPLRSLGR